MLVSDTVLVDTAQSTGHPNGPVYFTSKMDTPKQLYEYGGVRFSNLTVVSTRDAVTSAPWLVVNGGMPRFGVADVTGSVTVRSASAAQNATACQQKFLTQGHTVPKVKEMPRRGMGMRVECMVGAAAVRTT